MTPHEVVKDSLEKFEKEYDFINDEDEYTLDKYDVESFIEHLKSSHLSLLLSVKEMVESRKEEMFQLWRKTREQVYEIRYMEDEYLQSLLEEQKKELIEEILKLGQTDGGYRDMVWKELIESLK